MVALRKELVRGQIKQETDRDAQAVKKAVIDSDLQDEDTDEPVRILHLSDLHFNGEVSPAAKLQWLINDIKGGQHLGFDRVEYLVISGDMTEKGSEEGFEKAREFVSLLIDEFDLSGQRCIFVPGNHDLKDQTNSYRMIFPEEAKDVDPRLYVQQGQICLVQDEQKYPERFKLFSQAFYHNIVSMPYPLEYSEQGIAYLFPDTRIQFLTLNSSWEIDHFNRRRASIHPEALAHVLRKADEQVEKAVARGDLAPNARVLRIGVWHHAVAGPEMMQNIEFLNHLRGNRVRLCLHGDVHEMRRELIGHWYGTKAVYVVGSGSFGSPATGRPESTPRLYNLLEVQRDLSNVRVHTRRQLRSDGIWEGWHEWPNDERSANVPYFDVDISS